MKHYCLSEWCQKSLDVRLIYSRFPKDGFFFSLAFVLLNFIVTCLILYLIKSHKRPLSNTSLNSTSHEGTLSFIRLMNSGSSNRLELNFQYDGPVSCLQSTLLTWSTIAAWSVLMAEIISVLSTSS